MIIKLDGGLSTALENNGNKLTTVAVDNILSAFVAAGTRGGVLNLGGNTNAVPSQQGLDNKQILINRLWTVITA